MKRQLILEDGTVFVGEAFGSKQETEGEVVFNTGMTGYQETLSDPSYCDQIVTFTYPLIGNYGINFDDFEAIEPAVAGIIVKEAAKKPSHYRKEQSIDELLTSKNIPGLEKIDTRKLTRIIREHGTLKGKLCGIDANVDQIVSELRERPQPTDLVAKVSTKSPYKVPGFGKRVVIVDFGSKSGIIRECIQRKCDVVVVPYNVSAEEILRINPEGVVLTNGPGDPKDVPEALEMIRGILGRIPLFGICLGHQLLALACGGETEKMTFGHRGANQPVKDLRTDRVAITAQNHGYTVRQSSIAETDLDISHVSVNDGTVEGLCHQTAPAFSIQYHPEASPGPNDSNALFDDFIDLMTSATRKDEQHA